MSLKIDRVQLEIIIQQDEARQKMIELEESMRKARTELKNIKKQFGENSDEYKAQEQVIKDLKIKYDKLFEGIGIGKLSLKELTNRQRELNAIIRNLDPSLPQWKEYNNQLREVNSRIKELKGTAAETRFSISKMADGFNKYAAMGASVVASLTGVALTARKCVDEYAAMEEAEAQVIKYTGMTKNEVKELNEEFKAMDTRTVREKMNALAGDAGRLGITGKKDVLEFVDAADKINVALGEDLGEDAVKNIGKLAQMFGEDEKLGLRGAMLATGSAVNEVAQNSSAAEAYLVGFTARVAGAANQAKVAQGDILGYASVLDQNMQQQEMAATAFQTLMMKMYQTPAKFAKIAGQSVKEFSSLIKKDANEAILQFLEKLNKKGGLDQLAPMFKEMGLDGVRASGVISTMAGKIDDIRKAQKLANDAYRDGTSIINEFNVQNNTVQAGLDKAKKNFKDVRVELGEKLQPVMKYMITTGSLTVKGLSALVSVMWEYKGVILTVSAAVAAYTLTVKAATLWAKAHALATKAAAAATALFNTVTKASPWGMIAAGVMAVISYFGIFRNKTNDVTRSIREMNKEMAGELAQMNTLFDALNRSNEGSQQRKDILNEINEKYGTYLPNLLTEKSSLDEIESAYQRINTKLQEQIVLKFKNQDVSEEMESATGKQMDAVEEIRQSIVKKLGSNTIATLAINDMKQVTTEFYKAGMKWEDAFAQAYHSIKVKYYGNQSMSSFAADDMEAYVKSYYDMQKRIAAINQQYESWMPVKKPANQLDEVIVTGGVKGSTENGGGKVDSPIDEKGLKKELKDRETKMKETYNAEINMLKEKQLNEGMTKEQYQQEQYQAELSYLLNRKALLERFGKDASEIQGQIYDKMIAEANRLTQSAKDADKNAQSDNLATIDEEYQAQRGALKQAYISGDIKREADYLEQLKELERQYLEERRDMLSAYGEDVSSIDAKLQDMDLDDKKKSDDKQREQGYKDIDATSSFSKKNDLLQAMYDADLITFEEYQEEKTRIAEEQEQAREDKAKAVFDVIGQAASAASQVVNALQDAEVSKVTRQYDKKIKAAKKAGKDTTKLEEEKEEAINQVKKKYADKQFAASVLQVTASTAVAAMEAYKAMAGIPIVGPALGAIAAAAAVASGAAQIAVAKQQRDEAKGLKSGGYSDEYVEGYTDSGNPDDVAGVIPVHKNEFVTNHEGVANPHVRQFLDVFDVAQKNGTIRMLNTTQILEHVRTRSGKYGGGYVEDSPGTSATPVGGYPLSDLSPEQRSQIVRLLIRNNELLKVLTEKELVVDSRKVRDGIKKLEILESNVSR